MIAIVLIVNDPPFHRDALPVCIIFRRALHDRVAALRMDPYHPAGYGRGLELGVALVVAHHKGHKVDVVADLHRSS